MDQSGTTVDATAQDVANLALADASAARTALGLGTADAPSFAGLTITGSGAVVIPHIHGSIAGDFYVHVRNTSGGSLAAGTPVYATGSVGDTDRLTVAACDPTDPAKMPAIGLLKTTLANNGDGDGVVLGELRPFNTGGFQIRDRLYVGTGGLQATPPASGIVQAVGSVARVNAETGTILVGISAAMAKVGISGAYADLSGLPTLGTAAATDAADYATAAQGALADSATQPGDLAAVATSGAYSDLSGTPTLGSAAATDATDYATAAQGGLADSAVQPGDLATVATSGDYDDLINLPTLGTAAATAATDYAPAAQGVTGGDGHNHSGGDGAQIAYSDLSGVPTIPAPADAAPQPPGVAAIGVSTDYAREDHVHALPAVMTTSAAGLQAATRFGTINYAASLVLDLLIRDGQVNTITLTGDLELDTSNLANGRRTGLRLIAGAATRTLTFPVGWQFVSIKPATLPANKVARMTIECHGSSNASVIAGISIQP
ncbi:MAG: hypothetical protein ACO3C6_08650 [Steroidobacteraceae bacterium]